MALESTRTQILKYCTEVVVAHIDRTLAKIKEIGGIELILFPEVESRLLHFVAKKLLEAKYKDMRVQTLRIMASERMLGSYEEHKNNWETVNDPKFYAAFQRHCREKEPYDLIKNVKGKRVAVIDDMIETGKTAVSVGEYLAGRGARLCLVSSIGIIDEGVCEKIGKKFGIPVMWAHKSEGSWVMPRNATLIKGKKEYASIRIIFNLNIALFYHPQRKLPVSQRLFYMGIYDDFKSSGIFNMVTFLKLKFELERLVDKKEAGREDLEKARWSGGPCKNLLTSLFGNEANAFLYHLNRKEWFEEAHKDIGLVIDGSGKMWQARSDRMPELLKRGAKKETAELKDEIGELENMYAQLGHPFEYTPSALYDIELYSSDREWQTYIYSLKKALAKHIEEKYS